MSETQWRTHRLELDDQTLREWDAVVLASDPDGIVLDTSAFYPGGGTGSPSAGIRYTSSALRTPTMRVCTPPHRSTP